MSLRLRVLAGLILIAVVMGIGAFTLTRTTRSNLQAQVDAQLNSAAALVANFDFATHDPHDSKTTDIRQLSTLYVGYVTAQGTLETIEAPDFTSADSALPSIDIGQARTQASHSGTFTVSSTNSSVRYRVHAVRTGNQEIVLVALPLNTVDQAVSRLITLELIMSGIGGVVLVLVGWWVIHLGVRPLKSMTSAASAIAAGDLSARVPEADAATEAGELGIALNTMLARIEVAFDQRTRSQQRLQQFVADASHELRTPVATIRGYAELFRKGGLDATDALADAMRRTEQEAVRMGGLVDDLLLLAKLDERRPSRLSPVDLGPLVDDAALDAHALDPSRSVTRAADPGVVVLGDVDQLRQVLANVMANAIVHTPPGTPIEISAVHRSGAIELRVADHGRGIPHDLVESVFERFTRVEASRSRDRGGSGLGLSIVDAIAAAHGAAVRIDDTPGGGATVVVAFPAVPVAPSPEQSGNPHDRARSDPEVFPRMVP